MKIRSVQAVTCRVPIPHPIDLGALHIAHREYVVVTIETDSGLQGVGYGMTRDTPVAAIVQRNLTPLLLNEDPLLTERLWNKMYDATLPAGQRGPVMRALSIVDVALWDLKGKAAGLPLYQLLGGSRREVPVVVVGGYPDPRTSLADLAEEMRSFANRGFPMVKMALGSGTPADEAERVRVAREALGNDVRLMIDVHWSWHSLQEAIAMAELWRPYGLTWIEDPFPPEDVRRAAEFRHRTQLPVAIGDEQHGRWAFRELILHDAVDYLRLDATTIGGLTEFGRVAALAATWAIPIGTHIYHNIHIHCAAAFAHTLAVEYCEPDRGIDCTPSLLVEDLTPHNGCLRVPETPGLGVEIDDRAVRQYAVEP
jgi:D-arabinonate dehydratase